MKAMLWGWLLLGVAACQTHTRETPQAEGDAGPDADAGALGPRDDRTACGRDGVRFWISAPGPRAGRPGGVAGELDTRSERYRARLSLGAVAPECTEGER